MHEYFCVACVLRVLRVPENGTRRANALCDVSVLAWLGLARLGSVVLVLVLGGREGKGREGKGGERKVVLRYTHINSEP